MKPSRILSAILLAFGARIAHAQVNLTPGMLFPSGDTPWTLDDLGVTGTKAFRLLVEHSGSAGANSFCFDAAINGFPGGVGTLTDDLIIFSGSDSIGKIVTMSVPPGAHLSAFHDITDATGVDGSGPDGVLDINDAYLNTNPARNYTRVGADQLIKYYGANPQLSYEFTAFGQTVHLGSGFELFIFVEEDHTANYDYNDLIIGIYPRCNDDSNCDDGLHCNGVEHCVFGHDATAMNTGVCVGGTSAVCDDGIDCTIDECHEELGGFSCLYKPHDQECDDENPCNGVEQCDAVKGCLPGTPPVCDDGVACTVNECDPKLGCEFTPDDSLCADGDVCDGQEVCHRKKGCLPGTPLTCDDGLYCNGAEACLPQSGCQPGTPISCSHLNSACLVGVCNESSDSCTTQPVPNGQPCDDGLFCNVGEQCIGGQCSGGGPKDCGDGVLCTVDACNEATDQCTHDPNHAFCGNGQHCDGNEICDPVQGCQPGTPVVCNDSINCTTDRCDEPTDLCVYTPDNSLCNNGQFCDGVEICNPQSGCQDGPDPNCGDTVSCTVDGCDETLDTCTHSPNDSLCVDADVCDGQETCDPLAGCQPGSPLTCDDGLFCTGVELCDPLLGCQDGADPNCDDGVPCTTDRCDKGADACMHLPDHSVCADETLCNGIEICDPVNGCQLGTPLTCDDGLFCTGQEICDPLVGCQDGADPNCDDLVPCTIDECDEAANACTHAPNHEACEDGLFCNGQGFCDPVLGCQPGTPPVCDDGLTCTDSLCDTELDECAHIPDDADCANGLHCDGVEICDPVAGCLPGDPIICNDHIDCTDDSCDEVTDQCLFVPDDTECDDGLYCNGPETCEGQCVPGEPPCPPDSTCHEDTDTCVENDECLEDGDCQGAPYCQPHVCRDGKCVPDAPPSCDDGIPCTLDECDVKLQACVHEPDDSLCIDALYCNGTERCDEELGCLAGTPVICDDGIPCTVGTCDEATDRCVYTPSNAFCDDGLYCNGVGVCHPTKGCLAGSPPNCVDGAFCSDDSCDEPTDTCVHICRVPGLVCTDQTFECDNVGDFLPPVIIDDCTPNPVATCTETVTPGKLPQERTITRDCSFTNDCGNTATCRQVIKVEDTTPPEVMCPPQHTTCECDLPCLPPEIPTPVDNCDPDPEVIVTTEITPADCTPTAAGISPPPKLIKTHVFTITDGLQTVATGDTSGNTVVCIQQMDIIDTHGPAVVSCPQSVPGCVGQPLSFTPPTCSDTCGTCEVVCTRSDGQPLDAVIPTGELLGVRCIAYDECNNPSTACNVIVDVSGCDNEIPTVSQWGLVLLSLLLMIGAKLRFSRNYQPGPV